MSAAGRLERTTAADALCLRAYAASGGPETGAALVAVGGFGRRELAPYSDLDVVLVHEDGVDPGEVAATVWYPLWDSGAVVDHSVRSLGEMVTAAESDLKVALGLLDVRHLAGDPHLVLRLRTTMLAAWRRTARSRLPALQELVRARHRLMGELAHVSVPDLKEAEGGIRDATVLKALVATWLVDVPHTELERTRLALLDVRDDVHDLAGRATDRVAPEMWSELAVRLGVPDARRAQVEVRELGRRTSSLSRLTWRRVDDVLARPARSAARRPSLVALADGVALAGGEVVLDRGARPDRDPLLLLRVAAEAAEADRVVAPPTAARLGRDSAPLPEPWPEEARRLLVRLLAAGRGLLATWETLEETGALARLLPEWSEIRSLPHASAIHRFTVDRHVLETCVEASALLRGVARPDVLVVAALLHDIGKGRLTEHSVAGEPIARAVATRIGLAPDAVDLVATLVRWHLLLVETATTRDPDDPATVEHVAERVGSLEALDLLVALSEADARAASPQAWSTWRAGLVHDLGRRVRRRLEGLAPAAGPAASWLDLPPEVTRAPDAPRFGSPAETPVWVRVEPGEDGARVSVVAPDRVGLLADVAAAFALARVPVRAARAWGQDGHGVTVWEVADLDVDAAVLRQRYRAVVEGRVDPAARLRPPPADLLVPSVVVRADASERATVLEVRTADRPGVLHLVCRALADLEVMVRSAHVDTLGPQAVDVFYLQESGAGSLGDERAARAAHAVRAALRGGPAA